MFGIFVCGRVVQVFGKNEARWSMMQDITEAHREQVRPIARKTVKLRKLRALEIVAYKRGGMSAIPRIAA